MPKVQIELDSALVADVSKIYERFGFDVQTALEMFLVRSKINDGLPIDGEKLKDFTNRCRAIYEFNHAREKFCDKSMTMEEINAEIAQMRAEKKNGGHLQCSMQ